MKYVTYIVNGVETAGILSKDMNSVHSFAEAGLPYTDMLSFIAGHRMEDVDALSALATTPGKPLSEVKLMAPITKPHHDIICIGLNYMSHVAETTSVIDTKDLKRDEAIYFSKRVNKPTGPEEGIDGGFNITDSLDYEAELGVVIGKDAKHVKTEDAWNHVFGLMCFNDVSARNIQRLHKQWFFGKSLDSYTAYGPWIVSVDEFNFPLELQVQSRVNGELRQDGNTKDMIFSVEYIISELSQGMTLDSGSIIATGTPSGVGIGFDPPKFMKSGDICEIEIKGCGILRNKVL